MLHSPQPGKSRALQAKRHAFALCTAGRAVNAAVEHYKNSLCGAEAINWARTVAL